MKQWRYTLDSQFAFKSDHLNDILFANEWISIQGGQIVISAGYSWDGCSPTKSILNGMIWLGPWDGPLQEDGRPAAFYPSLVHDALCQFKDQIYIRKASAVAVFDEMLGTTSFPRLLRDIYVSAVNEFGPQYFFGDNPMASQD